MARSQPDEEQSSPFGRRGFIAAAAFLAALVVLGGVVGIDTGGREPQVPPSPPLSTPPAGTPGIGSTAGACPTSSDTDTSVPTTAPEEVSWELFRTVALPTSKAAGPQVVEGDVARCYARTPTGALLAAAQISVRSTLAEDWRPVLEQQVTGDLKEAVIKAREKEEAAGPSPDPQPGELGQLAGFTFVTYDRDVAVIDLVTRVPGTTELQSSTATVRWWPAAHDWLYEVPEVRAKVVGSLNGYVPWGGV